MTDYITVRGGKDAGAPAAILPGQVLAAIRDHAIFTLDRDGTINRDSDQYIKTPAEWRPIPGSLEAIAKLHQSGYQVVLATNQSGVGRGLFEVSTLNAIHDRMHRALAQIGATFLLIHLFSYRNFAVGTAYSRTEPAQAAIFALAFLSVSHSVMTDG